MKTVTLYTIEKREVRVADSVEDLEFFRSEVPPTRVWDTNPQELIVSKVYVPIRRVIKRGEAIYVAIEQELEQILMAPKIGDYEHQIYDLNSRLTRSESRAADYAARIASYNSLPWWKKLFARKI